MIKDIENETLQNIELHIKEQDVIINDLLKACRLIIESPALHGLSTPELVKVQQTINKAEKVQQ